MRISQNSPVFDSNSSKDDDRNLTVSAASTSQAMLVNGGSNNDKNNGGNLIDISTESEALKAILMEELYHVRQQVKKLNIEEVKSVKER